ncbi:general substrate transporter, partial [Hortaea werneckii]
MARQNWYYYLALLCIACAGIPKGYDEGGFSASTKLDSFVQDFNLQKANWEGRESELADRKANISSFGVLGAAFGSLIAILLNDRVFSSGIYGLMLFARIWGGLGAGSLTVTAPLFLAEIATARRRGLMVSLYMVVLLSFLTLGFFINYGASVHMSQTREQYRLVQAIPLIPVGIAFVCSWWMDDTPRWLASQDRYDEAIAALSRLRGTTSTDPSIREEFEQIEAQRRQKVADLAATSLKSVLKEIATVPTYRSRFLLVMTMQTVAQWSGGNGITYYIPEIFQYAGINGEDSSLISSGAYGIVKLVFTMVFAWGLIDIIGRRRCFLTGLGLQLAAHIYMCVYMSQQPGVASNKPASNAAIASVFIYAVGWSIGL